MSGTSRAAVIVADGESGADGLRAVLASMRERPLVIAADGGARRALAAGIRPDLVVGDGDSLGAPEAARLMAEGIAVELAPVDKDESDTELCLRAALARGASVVRLVGALGGPRIEHGAANLLLLALPALDGLDVAIVEGSSTIRRIGTEAGPGSLELEGAQGDHVSLLPIDSVVEAVRTAGLRFPLDGEPLRPGPARGLSNELLGRRARVTTGRGRLLVIHTVRTAGGTEGHA